VPITIIQDTTVAASPEKQRDQAKQRENQARAHRNYFFLPQSGQGQRAGNRFVLIDDRFAKIRSSDSSTKQNFFLREGKLENGFCSGSCSFSLPGHFKCWSWLHGFKLLQWSWDL
jgi:hypothetical protein